MAGSFRPFFSIITPVYNRADFVVDVIRSALSQTFLDFELIIIDDGSTDETGDRVRTFSDRRIRYIRTDNRERGAARNTGAEAATGAYLNFFDSDDRMYEHHLLTAFSYIQKNDWPKWFHVGYDIYDEDGKLLVRETGTDNPEEKIITTNYLGCDSVFIQKDLFMSHRFIEDRRLASSEDWELWLRLISTQKLMRCPEVTFRMIHHKNRSLLTIPPDRVIERDTFMLEQLLQYPAFKVRFQKDLPLFEADRYTFFALCLIVAGRRKEAIAYLKCAYEATPRVMARRRFWACVKHLILSPVK